MATIKDVAKLAGVSVATVSRVLNDYENVRPETVDVVQKAIQELDYHPNFLGRTLRRLETMKILVVVPTISNQFYSRVVKGIQTAAQASGYHTMLAITNADPEIEQEHINMARRKLVDGVIFLHTTMDAASLSEFAASYPAVSACELVENAVISSVSIDDYRAALDGVRFLLENGHQRIAFVSAGNLYNSSRLRRLGYEKALTEAGIPIDNTLIFDEGFTFNAGRRAAARILALPLLPDAVFATSDSTAIGVISALSEQGIRVCENVSVMGFDNNQISEYYLPPLTTISQPQFDIGHKAFELLLDKIQSLACEDQHILLPHKLECRCSVKNLTGIE
ncbi:MAG: LacI family DNA-binding transcriptional regulator [Candidatus Merdivicinus sp.]|jgi:LacI family repressor for deo operon, udp, cdd, tsx, nupC, and nupG